MHIWRQFQSRCCLIKLWKVQYCWNEICTYNQSTGRTFEKILISRLFKIRYEKRKKFTWWTTIFSTKHILYAYLILTIDTSDPFDNAYCSFKVSAQSIKGEIFNVAALLCSREHPVRGWGNSCCELCFSSHFLFEISSAI